MTNEQKQVRDWMKAFGQECPEKPEIPPEATRLLRAKLIFEETLETLNGLGFALGYNYNPNKGTGDWVFSPICEPSLKEIADGCSDLKVVTEGTLVACGLVDNNFTYLKGNDPLFDEVMRSNFSKMWTRKEWAIQSDEERKGKSFSYDIDNENERCLVVKDKDGKVIKSPSYSPANLQPIIEEMSK